MVGIREIVCQDLRILKKFFEQNDFEMMNVVANRIMTNLLVGENKDLMIVGWMLKDLAGEFQGIKNMKKDMPAGATESGKRFIDKIAESISSNPITISSLWRAWFEIEADIVKYTLSTNEVEIYTGNPEFSRDFSLMLLEYLNCNRNVLLKKNNGFITGIAYDIGRVANEYGGEESYIIYLIFRALEDYYRYLTHDSKYDGEIAASPSALLNYSTNIDKYIDTIYELKRLIIEEKTEDLYINANRILGDLGIEYRKYVLIYPDVVFGIPQQAIRKEIKLSEKSKKAISALVAKSIEKEIK